MLQGILIIVFMIAIMALMVTRKMPTVIALFVLTVGICLIGGVPMIGVDADGNQIGFLQTVIQAGATKLGDAIMVSIFAGWLGMVMEKTQISETMIKKGAELGGDKTLVVTLILFIVASLLFTTVNGLGTVIMVGTIVIPILVSVGADKFTASAVMLFAYCVGNNINMSNVNAISAVVGADFNDVQLIQAIGAVAVFIVGIIFFVARYKKTGKKYAFSAPAGEAETSTYQIKGVTGALAMLTPTVPLVLVIVFKFPPDFLLHGGSGMGLRVYQLEGWLEADYEHAHQDPVRRFQRHRSFRDSDDRHRHAAERHQPARCQGCSGTHDARRYAQQHHRLYRFLHRAGTSVPVPRSPEPVGPGRRHCRTDGWPGCPASECGHGRLLRGFRHAAAVLPHQYAQCLGLQLHR